MGKAVLSAVAISLFVCSVTSRVVNSNDGPRSLLECFDQKVEDSQQGYKLAQSIQDRCFNMFFHQGIHKNMTLDEVSYLQSLFRKVISETVVRRSNRRPKRFAKMLEVFPKRIRREVRDPMSNWAKYSAAVRRLKFDMSDGKGKSRYDTIADVHRIATEEAHDGPNFLPWHRLYLLVFETAVGVAIPYWDSTIDYEMDDPVESEIWTEDYFGNGFGEVESGPFNGFITPVGPLIRNIGSDGSLLTKKGILRILSRKKLAEISDGTAADEDDSLEAQHAQVHIWVDGQMNNIKMSTFDPVFWNLHSFVDYIWELFRTRQKTLGINPATDFVPTSKPGHLPNDEARGITGYLNVDGYSNRIAGLVEYKLTPACPQCCDSPAMYCDKLKSVCVGKDKTVNSYVGKQEYAISIAKKFGLSDGNHGKPFSLQMRYRDSRARVDSVTLVYTLSRDSMQLSPGLTVRGLVKTQAKIDVKSRSKPKVIRLKKAQSISLKKPLIKSYYPVTYVKRKSTKVVRRLY